MEKTSLKLMVVAGARPNFMKVAPIIHRIQALSGHGGTHVPPLAYRLVHTGQHYDQRMSDVFFDELRIPAPHFNLGVGSGSHAAQTAGIISKFEPVCESERPDWVVVVGDVNSTMACTLVCAKMGIRVAHVEAGLRSFDRSMPEEVNRLVTDAIADLLLTPSEDAGDNLRREGVPAEKIGFVGNVMIDALVANLDRARSNPILDRLALRPANFVYVTLHRPSNVDERQSLTALMGELTRIARDLPVVFPMHPRTRKMCDQFGIDFARARGLHVIDPVGYHESLRLTETARFVLTDSGGLQEESTFFRTPCLTLRPNTERPVTVTVGSNRLTSLRTLSGDIDRTLAFDGVLGEIPPLWDGRAAERIVDRIVSAG